MPPTTHLLGEPFQQPLIRFGVFFPVCLLGSSHTEPRGPGCLGVGATIIIGKMLVAPWDGGPLAV